jgi:uncharacterized membrane protein
MYWLSKWMPWLITALFGAVLVTEAQFIGSLLSQPQPVRDLDPSWKYHLIGGIVSIFMTVACFWLYVDFKIRSKPPQQSDF